MKFQSIIIIILLSYIISLPEEDLVHNLTGYEFERNMSSGYLNVSEIKQLHYIYLEAEKNDSEYLIIWYNGGPFCSSLVGWSSGNGPLVFENGKFVKNDYTWNKLAHMVYIESPAGAGFSLLNSTNKEDLKTNDFTSAEQNFISILNFYNKFPELKSKKLYLSGESYAGIYIPMLADKILQYNQNCTKEEDKIPLEGIMIGNAYTDKNYEEEYGVLDFAFSHGFLSYESRKEFLKYCIEQVDNEKCESIKNKSRSFIFQLNVYDYLRDKEEDSPFDNDFYYDYVKWRFPKDFLAKKLQSHNYEKIESRRLSDVKTIKEYLNEPEVKKALNVYEHIKWLRCNEEGYNLYDIKNEGTINVYPKLVNKIKILIYSGDTDIIVPINGSLNWIRKLNLTIKEEWQAWKGKNLDGTEEDDKVSGFRMKYDGLSFVSFKGCGHMVVEWSRKNSLYMVDQFLKGDF